jgi:MFS family permease
VVERAIRALVAVVAVAACSLVVGAAATGFGTMPECGTGSYFLYPMEPMAGVGGATFMATVCGATVIVVALPRWRGRAVLLLVIAQTMAAAAGAALSEAANGCSVWRDHSYAEPAAWIAGFVGLVVGTVIVLIDRAVRVPAQPFDIALLPAVPEGARGAGDYRVRRTEVAGVQRGAAVRLALTSEALLVLTAAGVAARFDRSLVAVDLDGETTIVAVDRYRLLELRPLGDTDAITLIRALERDPA